MSEPRYLIVVRDHDTLLTAEQREQRTQALIAAPEMTVGIDIATAKRFTIPPSIRKPRRPSTRTLVKRAEAATGRTVTAITTTAEGTKLDLGGTPDPAAPENPWPLDDFHTKETKQLNCRDT